MSLKCGRSLMTSQPTEEAIVVPTQDRTGLVTSGQERRRGAPKAGLLNPLTNDALDCAGKAVIARAPVTLGAVPQRACHFI